VPQLFSPVASGLSAVVVDLLARTGIVQRGRRVRRTRKPCAARCTALWSSSWLDPCWPAISLATIANCRRLCRATGVYWSSIAEVGST